MIPRYPPTQFYDAPDDEDTETYPPILGQSTLIQLPVPVAKMECKNCIFWETCHESDTIGWCMNDIPDQHSIWTPEDAVCPRFDWRQI